MKDPYSKTLKEPSEGIMGGYTGHDPMREKARKLMKYDLEDSIKTPESYSSPDNTKMRYYKKGGRISAKKMQESHGSDKHPKKINKDHYQMAKHLKGMKGKNITVEEAVHVKKGGQPKKMHLGGMSEGRPITGLIMKKGGAMKKATGGNVYERHMLGEHPTRKAPHINYESEMRGEKPVKRKMAEGGMAVGGEMKRGGKVKKKAMGGEMKKMAMGGATKKYRRDGIYDKKERCDYSK